MDRFSEGLGAGFLALLSAATIVWAFRLGGYAPETWLGVGLILAVMSGTLAPVGPSRHLNSWQAGLLAAFGLYALMTLGSMAWADSPGQAWVEGNRALLYLVAISGATLAVLWAGHRSLVLVPLLTTIVVAGFGLLVLFRLGFALDVDELVFERRLIYPISYTNALAAFLLIGFWGALCLSASRRLPVWSPPLLAGAAAMLVQLMIITQSRGAFWSLLLTVPVFLLLTPHRFRSLAHLTTIAVVTMVAWNPLHAIWRAPAAGDLAAVTPGVAGAVFLSTVAVVGMGFLIVRVESQTSPLDAGRVRTIGAGAALGAALLTVALLLALDDYVGGLGDFLADRWAEFVSDQGVSRQTSTRFAEVGLDFRLAPWRAAIQAFREEVLTGIGAGNFEFYYQQYRTIQQEIVEPHSQPIQALGETGIFGFAFFAIAVLGTLIRGAWLRFTDKAVPGADPAAVVALLVVGVYWTIHASVDWLWQMAAVTWPVALGFGGLLALTRRPPARKRFPARTALLGACLLFLISALPAYLAERYVAVAEDTSNLEATALAADRAALLNPYSPEPWAVLARSYRQAGRSPERDDRLYLALAAAAQAEAQRREPASWLERWRYGRLLEALGTTESGGNTRVADELGPPEVVLGARSLMRLDTGATLERAREAYSEAAALNPLSEAVQRDLERL